MFPQYNFGAANSPTRFKPETDKGIANLLMCHAAISIKQIVDIELSYWAYTVPPSKPFNWVLYVVLDVVAGASRYTTPDPPTMFTPVEPV
jgi:hypothetical protein